MKPIKWNRINDPLGNSGRGVYGHQYGFSKRDISYTEGKKLLTYWLKHKIASDINMRSVEK